MSNKGSVVLINGIPFSNWKIEKNEALHCKIVVRCDISGGGNRIIPFNKSSIKHDETYKFAGNKFIFKGE